MRTLVTLPSQQHVDRLAQRFKPFEGSKVERLPRTGTKPFLRAKRAHRREIRTSVVILSSYTGKAPYDEKAAMQDQGSERFASALPVQFHVRACLFDKFNGSINLESGVR
jgi:hypothetical protein